MARCASSSRPISSLPAGAVLHGLRSPLSTFMAMSSAWRSGGATLRMRRHASSPPSASDAAPSPTNRMMLAW